MKKAIRGILISVISLFTALVAGFSIPIAPRARYVAPAVAIAKPLKDFASPSQNQILQTATEESSYYEQLIKDVAQSNGAAVQDPLKETFKHHTVNGINTHKEYQAWTAINPYVLASHRGARYEVFSDNDRAPFSLQFIFKIEEWNSSTWVPFKIGNFTIQDIQENTWSSPNIKWDLNVNLDPTKLANYNYRLVIEPMSVPTGYNADAQATRNNFRDNGKTPNGEWIMRDGSYAGGHLRPYTAGNEIINEWEAINNTDFKRLINVPPGTSNISNIALNSLTFHLNFDGNSSGNWSKSRTIYFNLVAPWVNSSSTISSDTPFNSTGWKVDRLYMSPSDLSKNNFDASQWASHLHIYDPSGSLVAASKINVSAANLNKTTNTLAVMLKISNDSSDYYDSLLVNIPIHLINLDSFVKVSNTSSPFWEHLANGQTRYYSSKPTTKLIINNTFAEALYVATGKAKLIQKLDADAWGFIGNAKSICIDKINGYALTLENYDATLAAYQNQHDINLLHNLKPKADIVSLISSNNLANIAFEDYLYILKNTKFSFDFGVSSLITKPSTLSTLNVDGILNVSDAEVQAEDPYKTTWGMQVTNFRVIPNTDHFISTVSSKIAIDEDTNNLKMLYDLDLKYLDATKTSVVHTYLFQTHGIDISQNISFKMEDGSLLDENLLVTKVSSGSGLKIGDAGYVALRYWATFTSGVQEYVTLVKVGNDLVSPKYNNAKIIDLVTGYDEAKLEYVFNQELQMIVNPYQNTSGSPITSSTPQSFGIDTVSDSIDGNKKVLESWTDGKWSHSTDANGHAIFDGIFGADPAGNLDENGRLASGKHHIDITLLKKGTLNLKSNFVIVVDKQPVKIDVKSSGGALNKFVIADEQDKYKDLYFSHGSIHFTTRDTDLAEVHASFLDEKGNWYTLPITIKSLLVDNKWVQVIDSTIDYAGFAKVTIGDQAGNSETVYFYLTKDESIQPSLFYDAKLLQDKTLDLEFNSSQLDIFKTSPDIITVSPIGENLTINKMNYVNGNWTDGVTNDGFAISDYTSTIPTNYFYGKTLSSSQQGLPFAGDELKPFLSTPLTTPAWPMLKKQISFTKPGLYHIHITVRLNGEADIDRYIYIADPSLKPIDESLVVKDGEVTNISSLPTTDSGPQDNLDKPIDLLTKLNVDFPSFLIKDFSIKRSLLWYTEFTDLNINALDLTKEGKYLIDITDIFGNVYQYSLLVLDKSLDFDLRLSSGLTAICADRNNFEDTAFWKGKQIWSFYRYEDADHAKWEHDNFIDSAIKSGLSLQEAEALYNHLKQDANWDGNLDASGQTHDFNFKEELTNMTNEQNASNGKSGEASFSKINSLSKGQVGGVIAGTIIGSLIISGGITWLCVLRHRRKAIK